MAEITPVALGISGVNPSPVAASAGGDSFLNSRANTVIRVTNGGGSSINATLVAQLTNRPSDGVFPAMTLANVVVAVPAGQSRLIGPIPAAFNDGNGKAQLTYSSVTSVTIDAIVV